MGTELGEEGGTERYIAVLTALALADVDHHAGAVDVLRGEAAEFRAAHAGAVQRHEDGTVAEIGGAIDQAGDLLGAEDVRQGAGRFGQR